MVRLNEIINEEGEAEHISPTNIELIEQIEQYFEGDFFLMGDSTPASIKIRVTGTLRLKPGDWETIPFKIHKVFGTYSCADRGLNSLENAPDVVIGKFCCDSNNLTSLEHLPKTINNNIICYNNPLVSLKGIETDSRFNALILITYTSTLPLLRLMMLPLTSAVTFEEKQWYPQTEYKEVEDIINQYIRSGLPLKEKIYKCQYALIKAGYKGNAKW